MRRTLEENQPVFADAIQLHSGVSMSVQTKYRIPRMLIRIFIAVLGIVSSLLCVQGFYHFTVDMDKVLQLSILYTVVCGVVFVLPRKARWFIVFMLLGFEVAVYRNWNACLAGYRSVYRAINSRVQHEEPIHDAMTCTANWSEEQCVTFFICVLTFVIAVAITYFVVSCPNVLVCFILTFPLLECGLFFGYQTDPFAVFGLVTFWVAVMSMQLSNEKIKLSRKRKRKSENMQTMSFSHMGMQFQGMELTALLIAALVMWGGCCIISATKHSQRSKRLDNAYFKLENFIHGISFSSIADWFNSLDLPFDFGLFGDDIDLSDTGSISFNGSTKLNVTLENYDKNQWDTFYLKGTVRGKYSDNSWITMKSEYSDNEKLFKALQKDGHYPQTLDFSKYAKIFLVDASMRIQPAEKENVNYVPYDALLVQDENVKKFVYDAEVRMKDKADYSFSLASEIMPDWAELPLALLHTGLNDKNQEAYRQFVLNSEYMRIPQDEKIQREVIVPFLNDEYSLAPTPARYQDALEIVRHYLWEKAEYTLSPGLTPKNEDFVTYFLTQNHKGYCAHYASAAVLLCRSIGIPARYCQGYVIPASDVARGEKDGSSVKIAVPDYRSHAWVEIFVPTYGWLPYEFTEGVEDWWDNGSDASYVETTAETTAITSTVISILLPENTTTTTTTTAVTSTSAEIGSEATMTGSDNNGGGTTTTKKPLLSRTQKIVLLVIFLILLLIAAVIFTIRQRHQRLVSHRTHQMRAASPNTAADSSFAFIMQLLGIEHIFRGSETYEAFAKRAQETCKFLPDGAMDTVLAVQQAVVFSGREVPREDADKLCEIAQNLAKSIYDSADKRQQFILRWKKHIVQ